MKIQIVVKGCDEGFLVESYCEDETNCTLMIRDKRYGAGSNEDLLRVIRKILKMPETLFPPPITPGLALTREDAKAFWNEKNPQVTEEQKEMFIQVKQIPAIQSPANPEDIPALIPKFEYDHELRKEIDGYTNVWYAELPDGRVVVGYNQTNYYTTKENVMKIPYPIPGRYFEGMDIPKSARTPLKAYRELLTNPTPNPPTPDPTPKPATAYISKPTQEKIREQAEQKALKDKPPETKPEKVEMGKKTKDLREMVIKMGL